MINTNGKCGCCGSVSDLRFGFCYDCVNFESLVSEHLDMNDEKIQKTIDGSYYMNIVKAIIDYARRRQR